MPNKLIHENSPYLLQHANNPVDWYPWGSEALEKARNEDKPIFLSIGYAACHWCHVMEHESFEDNDTAEIMNQYFVNIKVDREERPDLDNIYMQAVVAMTRQGGWPMSVFLTPTSEPFYGGTYFPPVQRYNMPAFQEILETISRLWQDDRPRLLQSAQDITLNLQNISIQNTGTHQLKPEILDQATINLEQNYDWEYGGWGKAPKFPQPMVIEFLIQQAVRGSNQAVEMIEHALNAMAKGGMYDVVGGGFARYSVDNHWKIPHFEKMLYDNAQLARVYLHAHLITGNLFYRQVCERTLDFVLREMTNPRGGFYSSLDADSEGEEGKFYVWTLDEIRNLDLDETDKELLIAAYGITEPGNFEGANALQRNLSDDEIAEQFKLNPKDIPLKLEKLHSLLLEVRSQRIRPNTDDKVLTSWNALATMAFSEAGRYLKREDYQQAAIRNIEFLIDKMMVDGILLRSWREGKANHKAYLEDYAGLILSLLSLYQSDPQTRWYATAVDLAHEMVSHFRDPDGGFFDTRDDHEKLILRPKDVQDNATPSGNALAAMALLQLSAFTGNGDWRDIAEKMVGGISEAAIQYPTAFGQWLCAIDFAMGPIQEVAILGDQTSPEFNALTNMLWDDYHPHLVAAISNFPPEPRSPDLLSDRSLLDQKAMAYVCQNFVCQYPVSVPKDLENMLGIQPPEKK